MSQKKENPLYVRGKYTLGQKISTAKYNNAHYDNITLRVLAGQKSRLKKIASDLNTSVNAFIFDCIIARLYETDRKAYEYLLNGDEEQEK